MKDLINEQEKVFKFYAFNPDKIGIGDCIEFHIKSQLCNYTEKQFEVLPKKGIGIIIDIYDYNDYKTDKVLQNQQIVKIKNEKDEICFRAIDFINRNVEIKVIKSAKDYQ